MDRHFATGCRNDQIPCHHGKAGFRERRRLAPSAWSSQRQAYTRSVHPSVSSSMFAALFCNELACDGVSRLGLTDSSYPVTQMIRKMAREGARFAFAAGLACFMAAGCDDAPPATKSAMPAAPPAAYVGGAACAACHAKQTEAWRGSQHDRAMQVANAQTALGDFNDAKFSGDGVVSTFFKRDGKLFVRTDGPDGKLADFEVEYTFGVYPLQQYLIALPGGRLQALGDRLGRAAEGAGGQRWFHLYPDEKLEPGDPLHWTGIDQNWNYQCADCHSTNLRKNYDAADVDVQDDVVRPQCRLRGVPRSRLESRRVGEAGTATGSASTAIRACGRARRAPRRWVDDRPGERQRTARDSRATRIARSRPARAATRGAASSPTTCAAWPAARRRLPRCAARSPASTTWTASSATRSTPTARSCRAGCTRDGVTCSDCHEPHSPEVARAGQRRLRPVPRIRRATTHRRTPSSRGIRTARQCAACHMPTTTYMLVDPRHDHSLPHSAARSHASRSAFRTRATVATRNSRRSGRRTRWRSGFRTAPRWLPDVRGDAARRRPGAPGAQDALIGVAEDRAQPSFARASAVQRLARYLRPTALPTLQQALNDADPSVRAAAVGALADADAATRARILPRMLDDPVRQVRMEAARALAGEPEASLRRERPCAVPAGARRVGGRAALQRGPSGSADRARQSRGDARSHCGGRGGVSQGARSRSDFRGGSRQPGGSATSTEARRRGRAHNPRHLAARAAIRPRAPRARTRAGPPETTAEALAAAGACGEARSR